MKRHHWVSIGLAAALALAIAPLVAFGGHWVTLLGHTVQNLGHIPLFGVIAVLLLVLAAHWSGEKTGLATQYLAALTLALIVGVATEYVQMLGPRDADLWDVARNVVGIAFALVWCATFDRRLDGTAFRRAGGRTAFRVVATVVVLIFLAPLVGVANSYRERANRFPVLFSFETASQTGFLNGRLAWFDLAPTPAAWSVDAPEQVLHVVFSQLAGGALVLNEPCPDWTGHTALVLTLFNPGQRPVEVGLRIDDRKHVVRYIDRFNRHVFLEPGLNRLRIPMEEIVAGPAERKLDISSIDRLVIFAVDPVGGYEIYLGSVLLEPGETVISSTSPD